jgi:hypothetical protein
MSTGETGMKGEPAAIAIGPGNPEAAKYGRLWTMPEYRQVAPGETWALTFIQQARPARGAEVIDFGCGTGRGAVHLAVLGDLRVTMVDFVNNCLDPDVVAALATQPAFRFVKADLERGPLPHAAYGYCTDVLEHIPPDKVELVLNNILTAAQHVFFSISTEPDQLGRLIGEPLHLTVQPYGWWLEHFRRRNCHIHWTKQLPDTALFYVTGWSSAQAIQHEAKLNVAETTVADNVRHNIRQGWTPLRPHDVNTMEVMILGGGPSLADFEQDIRDQRAAGVKLVTLNGTYNWCLERGLLPSATLVVDARPFNARFVQPVIEGCKYLIASQCDPAVFEGLPRDRTFIWHSAAESVEAILAEHYEDWWACFGGSTILMRAIPLLRMLGFKRFHLYGCDSCLAGDTHHAYAQPENDGALVLPVIAGNDGVQPVGNGSKSGRVFYCTAWMLSQAQEFMDLVRVFGHEIELEIYGDGLLRHLMEVGASLNDREG